MTLHAKKLLDAPRLTTVLPFSKWMYLYFQMGFYRGHTLEKWLAKKIAHKNIYTFNDIQQGHLKIIVVDLTLQKVIVIPDDLQKVYQINPNTFSVAKAARISAGFPLFFMPYRLKSKKYVRTSYMVDGGVVSNFPMSLLPQPVSFHHQHIQTHPDQGKAQHSLPVQAHRSIQLRYPLPRLHHLTLQD